MRSPALPPRALMSRESLLRAKREMPAFHTGQVEWPGEDSGWLITFSDLTLLLLCFLVIWYVTDKQRVVVDKPQAAVTLTSVETEEDAKDEIAVEENAAPAVEPWEALRDEMEKYVEDIGLGEGVGVVSTQHELLISLKDTVPFASGEAELQPEVLPVLERVAAIVRSQPDLTLEVMGHTDNVPISTPEFPSNWELSVARASRVARYLVEQGVAPGQISAQGYAYFRPLLPNTNVENQEVNRRVEIRLYRPMEGEPMAK